MVAGSKKEREGGEAQKDSNAVANPGNVGSESDPAPEGQGAEEGETRWGERRYADTNFGAHERDYLGGTGPYVLWCQRACRPPFPQPPFSYLKTDNLSQNPDPESQPEFQFKSGKTTECEFKSGRMKPLLGCLYWLYILISCCLC